MKTRGWRSLCPSRQEGGKRQVVPLVSHERDREYKPIGYQAEAGCPSARALDPLDLADSSRVAVCPPIPRDTEGPTQGACRRTMPPKYGNKLAGKERNCVKPEIRSWSNICKRILFCFHRLSRENPPSPNWVLSHDPRPLICHSDQRDGAFCRPGARSLRPGCSCGAEESLFNFGFQVKSWRSWTAMPSPSPVASPAPRRPRVTFPNSLLKKSPRGHSAGPELVEGRSRRRRGIRCFLGIL